jgi:hypothetical protein
MLIKRCESAEEFLDTTRDFRGAELVRTNLISSIASSVASGIRKYEECFWWVAFKDEKVLGLAIRTAPFGYVISPMDLEVIAPLISKIREVDSAANEFAGPKVVINQIEEILALPVVEVEGELIYSLTELNEPLFKGEIRVALDADFDLIYMWMIDFIKETGIRGFDIESSVRNSIAKGFIYILLINGQPVSFAGFQDPIELLGKKIGRVGPVYTPKEFRKNGYAGLVTAHVTKKIIDQGAIATLYTQADNPTSNKIHQELGYVLVDENRRIKI